MTEILPRHKRMVLWGFTTSLDSFRHNHRHYAHALERLGKPYLWLSDDARSREQLQAGDLVFAVDVEAKHLGEAVDGVDYLLHNLDDSFPVFADLAPERYVRLQVYTNDAEQYGEAWGLVRRYDHKSRTLFQPWGTNLFADEFCAPTFRDQSKLVTFIGSVWDDNGLGNVHTIAKLRDVINKHGLKWLHLTHISDQENVEAVREARLAPAIAGEWQVTHNYLPCRVFKNISYGALGITNVPKFSEILGDAAVVGESIKELIEFALTLPRSEYLRLVHDQQRILENEYTYWESLLAIERAFEEGR